MKDFDIRCVVSCGGIDLWLDVMITKLYGIMTEYGLGSMSKTEARYGVLVLLHDFVRAEREKGHDIDDVERVLSVARLLASSGVLREEGDDHGREEATKKSDRPGDPK